MEKRPSTSVVALLASAAVTVIGTGTAVSAGFGRASPMFDGEPVSAWTVGDWIFAVTLCFGVTRTTKGQRMTQQSIQYRDDLVRCFVDTEFYEDGSTVDLISIGAVRSDGGEFYAVNQDAKLHLVSAWVREHVLPQLPPLGDKAWMPRERIAQRFSDFMGANHFEPRLPAVTEVWGYYSDYDWVAICQLYGTMMGLPNHFPRYCLDLKQLSWMLGNPKHPAQKTGEHHALEDARWNRDLYAFLRTVPSGVWGYGR